MLRHASNRLQALHTLTPSTLTSNSLVMPLYAHYNLTITVDWRTGKFEFDSEVDLKELAKPINQDSKNFNETFLETIEKVFF